MSERTYTEEEIQDLTDRVFLLKELVESEKIKVAAHLVDGFKKSYGAIRLREDGLVDPKTVNGQIRATTLAIRAMRYREDMKKQMSLAKIQTYYFAILEREFGTLFKQMNEAGATPAQAAEVLSSDKNFVDALASGLPGLLSEIQEFWQTVSEVAEYHLQDGRQMKAVFGGDIFPQYWENPVSSAGLYVDTIVLPCPLMRLAPLVPHCLVIPPEKKRT